MQENKINPYICPKLKKDNLKLDYCHSEQNVHLHPALVILTTSQLMVLTVMKPCITQ